jgi:hypothetical protein
MAWSELLAASVARLRLGWDFPLGHPDEPAEAPFVCRALSGGDIHLAASRTVNRSSGSDPDAETLFRYKERCLGGARL